MRKILLCCNLGMSTSLLVTNMEKYAKEQGIEAKIWALSVDEASREIKNVDVVLIGPQIRYMLGNLKKIGDENDVPVDVINTSHYGMMKGDEVVKAALKLIEENGRG